jgi:hypothetical protein
MALLYYKTTFQRGLAGEMGRRVIAGHTPDRELIEGTFPGRA